MKEWFAKLTPGQQLAVAAIAFVVVYYAWKAGKEFLKTLGANAAFSGEAAALAGQGQQASFNTSQYASFANQLESAMAGPGTKESVIFSVYYQMNNDLDIVLLDKAFGMRSTFWTSPANLQQWLRDDLSAKDMEKLNDLLAAKGITKRY